VSSSPRSGTRRSPPPALRRWSSEQARKPSSGSPTPICSATLADMRSPTESTTPGRSKPTSGTATSSTRCVALNCRRCVSRTSGDGNPLPWSGYEALGISDPSGPRLGKPARQRQHLGRGRSRAAHIWCLTASRENWSVPAPIDWTKSSRVARGRRSLCQRPEITSRNAKLSMPVASAGSARASIGYIDGSVCR
jgi:hypothetical protein